MSAFSGFIGGVVGLSLLELVVSNTAATDRAGGAFVGVANVVRTLASPYVPAVPDLRVPASQRPRLNPLAPGAPATSTPSTSGSTGPASAASFTTPATRLPVSV